MSYIAKLYQFRQSKVVHDLRDPVETRAKRAARYAKRMKTDGKRAVFG